MSESAYVQMRFNRKDLEILLNAVLSLPMAMDVGENNKLIILQTRLQSSLSMLTPRGAPPDAKDN